MPLRLAEPVSAITISGPKPKANWMPAPVKLCDKAKSAMLRRISGGMVCGDMRSCIAERRWKKKKIHHGGYGVPVSPSCSSPDLIRGSVPSIHAFALPHAKVASTEKQKVRRGWPDQVRP